MSKERPFNINTEADRIVSEYSRKKLEENMMIIHGLEGEEITYEWLSELLKDTNNWIQWIGVSKKNFEKYRYRAFIAPDGSIEITQGKEIDSDP
jgi:hypothetical protein